MKLLGNVRKEERKRCRYSFCLSRKGIRGRGCIIGWGEARCRGTKLVGLGGENVVRWLAARFEAT